MGGSLGTCGGCWVFPERKGQDPFFFFTSNACPMIRNEYMIEAKHDTYSYRKVHHKSGFFFDYFLLISHTAYCHGEALKWGK